MPATRSAPSPTSATLDKEYFLKLIEPLAKSEQIDKRFNELLDTINKQNETIKTLNDVIGEKDAKIAALSDDVARLENNQLFLRRKIDDQEQYTRRYSLRINNIPTKEEGEREDVMKVIEECCGEMDTPFSRSKIDRAHRIGRVTTDKNTKKKVQPIIVKFRSWESRTAFYRARPKWKQGGGARRFTVALDLTKDRYSLLKSAREKIEGNSSFKYAYADINCRLTLRLSDDKTLCFNSMTELDNLINLHSQE